MGEGIRVGNRRLHEVYSRDSGMDLEAPLRLRLKVQVHACRLQSLPIGFDALSVGFGARR